MGSYLLVFFIAAACAAVLMPMLMALGTRLGALDDTQAPPIPRVGGWALVLGTFISLALVGLVFDPTRLTLLGQSSSLLPVSVGALAILALGTVDDIYPVRAWVKLLFQVAIALGVFVLGVRIELVSAPFGRLELAGAVSAGVTVLWIVGISNAFNLLDGADGIAAGSAFFAAAAVLLMSVALGHPAIGLVMAALAGALMGFLPFNLPPARAYLGDAGSLVIGFLLAGLAVEGSTKGPTLVVIAVPLVAFGLPVFDTTITLFRRFVRGRPLFERDQEHVHHHLQRAGLNPRQVVGVIYTASAAFALAAMMFINPGVRSYAVAILMVGFAVWMFARYLRLHELNELARVARRGAQQARSIVLNVQLRRAAERLADVHSLDDLKEGLALLLTHSEFDEVLLMASPVEDRRGGSRRWQLFEGTFVEEWPRRTPDEWEVVCPFVGSGWNGELRLRRRLGRRSLLLDLNLLLDVVQPALTDAARRIPAAAVLGP